MTLRVQEFREAAGLSKAEVARRAGVNERTIRNIERGVHQPTIGTAQRLAAALDVALTDLIRCDAEVA